MKSVMKHSFSEVPRAEIQRSSFDRSHGFKTTLDSGYLVPVFIDEALPGDTFNLRMTTFGRMATPIVPVMDNIFIESFFFFVPFRLVWDNFQKFMGEQANPDDSTDYLIPQMTSTAGTGYDVGSLHDYFGIPTGVPGLAHSSMWHRCYNLIYNEWFRDQNLQDSVVVDKDDGPDSPTDYVLLRRGKRHDYFTSCLPWPQKGADVTLPLGSTAPVYGSAVTSASGSRNQWQAWDVTGSRKTGTLAAIGHGTEASRTVYAAGTLGGSNGITGISLGTEADYASGGTPPYADLSAATAATINSLREAFQLQRLLERDARGGTRYTEIIRSHFGVTSPDARLQRPEYLGGGSGRISINPIAQTSESGAGTPQGNLAATGTLSTNGHGFTKSFTEHGFIIGLVSIRADLNYQQGLNRMFSRRTRYDLYWPALAHLGEQTVLNKEIYAQGTANPTADADVFGYQERYAEYRYKPSTITGQFRSTYAQSLDVWHLAQEFGSLPTLNATFIEDNPPISRVVATPDEAEFLLDAYFQLKTVRPMPMFGVPGLIDHF